VAIKRPTSFTYIALGHLNLVNGPKMLWNLLAHAAGHCETYTRVIVPADRFRRDGQCLSEIMTLQAGRTE
jgi:hypothetical protein